MTMNTEHDKPTPPTGFKLVKACELKAPFSDRLLVFTDEDEWDEWWLDSDEMLGDAKWAY